MFKSLVGDRAFYRNVLALAMPIMIQNGITHLVNMLDNIMIGSVGTVQMNGVTVANQLIFVFILCIFGAVSGAGIFTAQFSGNNDHEGVAHTMRFKLLFCLFLTAIGIGVFLLWGEPLINLYLQGEGDPADAAASLKYAKEYLNIMLIGLVPHALVQCYSSTLREVGQSKPPMVAGIVAVIVNLIGNYILIFGKFGAPCMGVAGAAVATVISRFVELGVLVVWTHTHNAQNPFAPLVYRSLRIPLPLMGQIFLRGLPLLANEAAWSTGMATLNQQYSLLGLNVVGANNICHTFWNVFAVAFMAMGESVGILLGQQLGAGDREGAHRDSRKLIAFSVLVSIVFCILYMVCAPFIPYLYNTTPEIRTLATSLMIVSALAMPVDAFAHASYFTLRSGGQAFITFMVDSCFMWVVNVSLAYALVHFTSLPIVPVFAACQFINLIKCGLGGWLVHKGSWIKTIVD